LGESYFGVRLIGDTYEIQTAFHETQRTGTIQTTPRDKMSSEKYKLKSKGRRLIGPSFGGKPMSQTKKRKVEAKPYRY